MEGRKLLVQGTLRFTCLISCPATGCFGSFRVVFFRAIIQAHNNLPQRVLAKGGYPRRCLSSSYALLQIHLLLVLVIFCFNYAEFRSVSGVHSSSTAICPQCDIYARD